MQNEWRDTKPVKKGAAVRGRGLPEAPFRHAGLLNEMNRNRNECLKQLFIYMLWQNEFFWKPTRRSVWFWQNEHERVRRAPADALKMNKIQHWTSAAVWLGAPRVPDTPAAKYPACSLTAATVWSFSPRKDKLSKLVEFNAPIGLWCCSLWGHHLLINTHNHSRAFTRWSH